MPSIPKQLHFIWIGGTIPEKYLQNIKNIAFIARRSGFKLNLWTDKDTNIIKSAVSNDISLDGIVIRNIAEVTEDQSIKLDLKYWRDFKKYVQMERSGDFKNLSAAADLLRYAILFKEGGMYIDADTVLHSAIGSHDPLDGRSERQNWSITPQNRGLNATISAKHREIVNKFKRDLRNYILSDHINVYGFQSAQRERSGQWVGGSGLLACQKDNAIMENILYACIDNYREAEKDTKKYKIDTEKQKNKTVLTSTMTAKRNVNFRYMHQNSSEEAFNRPKGQETIRSNVDAVGQGMKRYFETLHHGESKDSRRYKVSLLKYQNTLDYSKQESVAKYMSYDIYKGKYINTYRSAKDMKLYSMSDLPKQQSEYKNSYILLHEETKPRLYYVNKNGIAQLVKLNNFEEFLKRRQDLINSKDKKYSKEVMLLSRVDVENLITLNGEHSPFYKMPLFGPFISMSDQNWINLPEPKKTAGDTNTIANVTYDFKNVINETINNEIDNKETYFKKK